VNDRRLAKALLLPHGRSRVSYAGLVIDRIVRVAGSFREAERMDRADLAAMSFEERVSSATTPSSGTASRG
jgi:hypothetical protein